MFTIIENMINGFIKLINGAIDLINLIPNVTLEHVKEVHFTRLARGGVVSKPTLAEIGEAGAEAVVPLENNRQWIRSVAAAMADEVGGTTNNSEWNFTQNIYSPKPLSRIEIYRMTRNQINFAKMKAGV